MILDVEQRCRILSIQSHVVRGYVGNKAAVFPLQLLGYHVDFINTVQYTSLMIKKGHCATGEEFRTLLSNLPLVPLKTVGADTTVVEEDKLHKPFAGHKYLLTGYIGSAAQLEEIISYVKGQKMSAAFTGSKFLWLCDPVMGDNGNAYVAPAIMAVYQSVLHLTDIITPNQFELGVLSSRNIGSDRLSQRISSLNDAVHRCQILHESGPDIIVCTSLEFDDDQYYYRGDASGQKCRQCIPHGQLILLASERMKGGPQRMFIIRIKKVDRYLVGTGDLMAAMILDGLERFHRVDRACERAVAVMQGVIKVTVNHKTDWHEIDVIGGRHEILDPSLIYETESISSEA